MSHLGVNVLSAIHGMSANWHVRYLGCPLLGGFTVVIVVIITVTKLQASSYGVAATVIASKRKTVKKT